MGVILAKCNLPLPPIVCKPAVKCKKAFQVEIKDDWAAASRASLQYLTTNQHLGTRTVFGSQGLCGTLGVGKRYLT